MSNCIPTEKEPFSSLILFILLQQNSNFKYKKPQFWDNIKPQSEREYQYFYLSSQDIGKLIQVTL